MGSLGCLRLACSGASLSKTKTRYFGDLANPIPVQTINPTTITTSYVYMMV